MPELPEVETIARALRQGGRGAAPVLGARIIAVQVLWPRSVAAPSPEGLAAQATQATIAEVSRRGKFLDLHLRRNEKPVHLVVHLRMSGDLLVLPPEVAAPPHTRVVFSLHDGRRLVFNDPRKFGRLWLLADPHLLFAPLGPEPFDDGLTPARFYQRLQRHRRRIKPLLLDQRFLAGLGNIYADEALFLARIHPLTPANTLSEEQAATLLQAIRQVLREGIARNGTSIDWMYRGGDYQQYLRAYGRTGQPCPRCGTPITRIRVAQRSAHFCPICQPPPAA